MQGTIGRPPISDEHLRLVADLVKDDLPNAARIIQERFDVRDNTAYKWLHRARERGFTTWHPVGTTPTKPKRDYHRLTDERLLEVAAICNGCPNTRTRQAVAEHFDVPLETARYWIKRAREAGLVNDGFWRGGDRICKRCDRPWSRHLDVRPRVPKHNRHATYLCIQVLRDEIDAMKSVEVD